MRLLLPLSLVGLLATASPLRAQSDSVAHASRLSFGVVALTDNVYLGRRDVKPLPYLTPQVQYTHKSGIYGLAATSFVPTPGDQRLDLVTAEVGYDGSWGAHWNGGAYADRFFYQTGASVRSSNAGCAGAYVGYDNDWLTPSLEGCVNFGTQTDWVLTAMVAHGFYLAADRLSITPTVIYNAGTRHTFLADAADDVADAYNLRRRTVSNRMSGAAGLDWELAVPVAWDSGRWHLDVQPVYALPQHGASETLSKHPVAENLRPSFFAQATARYSLPFHHRS